MPSTTTIYGIHYPILADAPPDISEVGTLASDIDALVAKLDAGEALKQRVVAVATANASTTSAPATVDGVTLASGDLVLLTAQTTASQNGLWKFASAGAALTRPAGFTTGSAGAGRVAGGHLVVGGVGGTNNGGIWQNTNTGAITVDTTGLTYSKLSGPSSVATANLQDLAVTAAKIANGAITITQVAGSLKHSGTANDTDEALRALGTTAGTAAAGNDSRLSDTRTPTDASVTPAKFNATAIDPVAGTAGARTLGTGAQQATAGNDSRLTNTRTPTDGTVTVAKLADAAMLTPILVERATAFFTAGLAAGTYRIMEDGSLVSGNTLRGANGPVKTFAVPVPSFSGSTPECAVNLQCKSTGTFGFNATVRVSEIDGATSGGAAAVATATAKGQSNSIALSDGASSAASKESLTLVKFPAGLYCWEITIASPIPASNSCIVMAELWAYAT